MKFKAYGILKKVGTIRFITGNNTVFEFDVQLFGVVNSPNSCIIDPIDKTLSNKVGDMVNVEVYLTPKPWVIPQVGGNSIVRGNDAKATIN
jgi:hypothetical protein